MLWPLLLFAAQATAGWDPLQKAERAAARGARLLAEGDSLAAIEAYLEAQALAPDDDRIRMGLGEAFYENGEFKSALGQYRTLARPDEHRPPELNLDALYNAGNSAFEMGEYEAALENYTQALVAGSQDPDLLHNLELTQKLLEQAQSQDSQQGEGDPQDSEQQDQEQQQQDGDPSQQQQDQQQQDEQQQEQQDQQQQDEQQGSEEQQQDQPAAPPDSLSSAAADSLVLPDGMSMAEAMQLLEALDHDEEELRRSIMRRLRAGETESEHDW